MDEEKTTLSLSGDFWLAIFSLFSVIFYWYPNILLFAFGWFDEDERMMARIIFFNFPLQIILFIFSIKVLYGYIRFLRANQVNRFCYSVILKVLISLPALAGGISVIAFFLFWFISLLYFGLKYEVFNR